MTWPLAPPKKKQNTMHLRKNIYLDVYRIISPKPQRCGSFCKYSLEHFPFEEFLNLRGVDASWLLIGFPYSLPDVPTVRIGVRRAQRGEQLGETTMNDLHSPEDALWFPILPIYFTFAVLSDDIIFHCIDFNTLQKGKTQSVLGQRESTPARFSIENGNPGCSFVHL